MECPIVRVTTFYDGLDHPEGIAVHPDGSIWTGGEAGQIYRIAPGGTAHVFTDDWEAYTLACLPNIAFGCSHFDQLFAANLGCWHIARMPAGVHGAPLVHHLV